MLYDNQASYTTDMAAEIDREYETLADEYGISIDMALQLIRWRDDSVRRNQAEVLGRFIGILLESKNQPIVIHAFALAAGLDQLNGVRTEAEIAEEFGVSRALVSHYTVAASDLLSGAESRFDITKHRKRNETRQVYAEKAKCPLKEAKRLAWERRTKEAEAAGVGCDGEDDEYPEEGRRRDREIQIRQRKQNGESAAARRDGQP